MRKILAIAALAALGLVGACDTDGEPGEAVVTPDIDVDVSTDTNRVVPPDVDVNRDTATVVVPDVDVQPGAARP